MSLFPPDAQTDWTAELRRGANAYSLGISLLAALTLTAALHILFALEWLPGSQTGSWSETLLGVAGLFALITLLHLAAHGWAGWRLQQGWHALRAGEHQRALRLLEIVERPGMAHYDPQGHVQRAVQALRSQLDQHAA